MLKTTCHFDTIDFLSPPNFILLESTCIDCKQLMINYDIAKTERQLSRLKINNENSITLQILQIDLGK